MDTEKEICKSRRRYNRRIRCILPAGHDGNHESKEDKDGWQWCWCANGDDDSLKEKGVKLTTRQKRIKRAIKYLKHYMDTYDSQAGYLSYSDECIINDVIYGLGVALDKKYRYANGFLKFRERLIKLYS